MSEPSASGRWFYVHEGRRHGPVELGRLVDLILVQEIPEDCLIWRAGMPEWVKARDLDDIRRELPPPVPIAPSPPAPSPPEPHEEEEDGEDEEEVEEDDLEEEPPPSEPGATALGGPGSEAAAPAPPEGVAPRHHRHRHRHRRTTVAKQSFLRRWLVPLVIVLLFLIIGLWWLLLRMNEVPSGRVIIREGASRPPAPLAEPTRG